VLAATSQPTNFAEMMANGRRTSGEHGLPAADAAASSAALAAFGYRRDKGRVSDASVQSDAIHLEFAALADVFVTQDTKLRARGEGRDVWPGDAGPRVDSSRGG